MIKNKNKKTSALQSVLEEARRRTLIESTASSLRLAGINISNKKVEQIINLSILESEFKKHIEKILTQKQLAVWNYLQKIKSASPREISEKTKVAYPTVRQAIDKLMRLKKIERIGQGRSTSYTLHH
jgi:predicted HTH transcriptional regulator